MTVSEIRKRVVLRASRSRVWEALTDSEKFGSWFGCDFDAPFVAGTRVHGRVVPTKVDPEVAKAQEAYAGMEFEVIVDRIEAMRVFSFRWHPGDEPPDSLNADAEMTTVTFELEDAGDGVLLTITESGFDRVPLERRARVFELNDEGWAAQTRLIERYLSDAT